MRIEIAGPSSVGPISWNLRKRAEDDAASKARQERQKKYAEEMEAERKKTESERERAKTPAR
jgi:hypothetical protein